MQDNSPLLYRAEQMLRYLRNEMTVADSKAFEDWLSKNPAHQQFIAGLSEEQGMEDIMAFLFATEREAAWASLQQKLNLSQQQDQKGKIFPLRALRLWKKMTVAAAVLLVAGAGLYFYTHKPLKNKVTVQDLAVNDIVAGGNKAYLTLADGKKIALTDIGNGKVAEQAGLSITKTAEGQLLYEIKESAVAEKNKEQLLYNTITTPAGGQYQVVLPDGTHVWLNAASSLTYATSLANLKERKVELKGEAYFEVARQEKDQIKKPFIVKSRNQEVEVLGTHFNISSYEQESLTATTLLEGRVKVSRPHAFEETISPGEQSLVGKGIAVTKVDTSTAVAWKNGLFRFENANIYTVMNQFSRWYNFDVKYEGKAPANKFNGEIYRNLNASKALKILSYAKIRFRVESNDRNPERKTIVITAN